MRDVAAFLANGVDSMCPRGFRALANAAEVRPRVRLPLFGEAPPFFAKGLGLSRKY